MRLWRITYYTIIFWPNGSSFRFGLVVVHANELDNINNVNGCGIRIVVFVVFLKNKIKKNTNSVNLQKFFHIVCITVTLSPVLRSKMYTWNNACHSFVHMKRLEESQLTQTIPAKSHRERTNDINSSTEYSKLK